MRVGCQRHAAAALPSGQRFDTHSPRAALDGCGKSLPLPGFDPRSVQPVASRYTDCATLPVVTAPISI